jgi:hypothetical protein
MAGRPPGAQNKDKPFRDALRVETIALGNGEIISHPPGSLRSLAQALLMKGCERDVPAIREIADRLDGKVAQAHIGGDDDDPAVKVFAVVERVITDARQAPNSDGEGVRAIAGPSEV